MFFPKEFFRAEEREGFVIAEMMKRAWAAALEVLEVIGSVCDRNGIRYYGYGGTLLGCIRHKGFIPWDDDIDICMLRTDYNRFIEIAPSELPEGFVLSGLYASDPRLIAANKEPQIRVIADETFFPLPKYMDRFHAFPYMRIGIDIFPLDYLPQDPVDQLDLVRLIYDIQTTARFPDEYRKNGTLHNRLRAFGKQLGMTFTENNDDVMSHELWIASDKLAQSYPESDRVFDILYLLPVSDPNGFEGYAGADPDKLGPGRDMPFEHVTMRVPDNYDEILTAEFGPDYMTPVKFLSGHSYPFYKVQEEAFLKLLRESGVETPVDEFCRNWHMMNGGN